MDDDDLSGAERDRYPLRLVRRFLVVRLASSMAWQMQGVALGWYVYALTDSALDLGLIGLVQFLPFAGLALVAGHVVDRHARRNVVMAALTGDSACSIVLAFLALTGLGGAVPVFGVVAGYGAFRSFEQPAMQSWLPLIAGRAIFPRAAAWNSLTSQSAVIMGPALGGLLYLVGPAVPFVCAAALQACGLIAAWSLPGERRGLAEPMSWYGLLGGVRFIRHSPTVLGAISLDLFCVLFGGATALLPIFARDILGVGPAGLGLLRSAPALGAVVMGSILARRPATRRVGPRMMVAVAVYGVATLVFGLSKSVPLSVAALVCVGAADMLSVVIRSTLVQVASPDAIRGRVTAVNSLFTGASNQLGQFESGVTAAWFGAVGSVVLGGVATIAIVALWSRWFPALIRMDRLVHADDAMDSPREGVPGSSDTA